MSIKAPEKKCDYACPFCGEQNAKVEQTLGRTGYPVYQVKCECGAGGRFQYSVASAVREWKKIRL